MKQIIKTPITEKRQDGIPFVYIEMNKREINIATNDDSVAKLIKENKRCGTGTYTTKGNKPQWNWNFQTTEMNRRLALSLAYAFEDKCLLVDDLN